MLEISKLCLGMKDNGIIRWIELPYKSRSLYDVIKTDNYVSTSLGRNKWKSLLASGSLQQYCNKEGFNVIAGNLRVRIGIISNNHNECIATDSRVGLGADGSDAKFCYNRGDPGSCGNLAYCYPDNGNKKTKVWGYIFAK